MITVLLAVLLLAPPAQAHSELVRSDPPNGGMVAPGRSFLTLRFGEPISANSSRFDLHLSDGSTIDATLASVGAGGTVARLDTAELARGTYELDWRVISLDDGHPASGTLVFGVGLRPDLVSEEGDALPGALVGAVRWLDLMGLVLAVGALAVSGEVMWSLGMAGRLPRRRARSLAVLGTLASFYAGLLTPVARTQLPGNPPQDWLAAAWDVSTRTPWGYLWMTRQAVLLAAVVLVWRWARDGDRAPIHRRGRGAALAALAGVAVLEAAAGHPADLPSGFLPSVVASSAHLLAAGVWAGGLAVLVLCTVPLRRRDRELREPAPSIVWRRFSPMAAAASVVLLATGLYQAGVHVPAPDLLDSTVYGWAVVAKTALVLLALCLASVTTLVVNPWLGGALGRRIGWRGWTRVPLHRLAALVAAEAALLSFAVVLAALATSVPTSREVGAAREVTAPHREEVAGLFITFEELPAGPELATIAVRVQPTVLPPPAPVNEVRVSLRGRDATVQGDLVLTRVEAGSYEAQTAAPGPGAWTAVVAAQRAGMPDAVMRADWTVTAPGSDGPSAFGVVTAALAALLLVGLGGLAGPARSRSRRRHQPVPDTVPAAVRTDEPSRV